MSGSTHKTEKVSLEMLLNANRSHVGGHRNSPLAPMWTLWTSVELVLSQWSEEVVVSGGGAFH